MRIKSRYLVLVLFLLLLVSLSRFSINFFSVDLFFSSVSVTNQTSTNSNSSTPPTPTPPPVITLITYLIPPVNFTIANDVKIIDGNTNGIFGRAQWNFVNAHNTSFNNSVIEYTFCAKNPGTNISLLINQLELVQPDVVTQTKLFSKKHNIFPGEVLFYDNGCMYGTWNLSFASIPAMNTSHMPQLWASNSLFQLTVAKLYTDAHEHFYITNITKPTNLPPPPPQSPPTTQQIILKVDGNFASITNTTQTCNDFLDDMAVFLNIDRSRLECVSVTEGSIVFTFKVSDIVSSSSSPVLTATQVASVIYTEARDPNSAIQDILPGPVISINVTKVNTTTTTTPTPPTTHVPTTSAPTTPVPTTPVPTTPAPTTPAPTTPAPTTPAPTTPVPTTQAPTTPAPTTPSPTTPVPTTPVPTTPAPTTPVPTTPVPTTPPPTTPVPTTPAPTTLAPTTPPPTTPAPTTPAPTTPAPTTQAPTTPAPTTAAPTLPPGYYTETHVFLLIGQSNEAGYGTPYNSSIDTTDPLIVQLGQRSPNVGQLFLASDPLDHNEVACATCIGHGMSFARSYIALHPAVRVILVPTAQQGTGFSGGYWHTGDSLYNKAVSQANLVMSLSPNNTKFVAFLWDQGEADTGHGGVGFAMGREAYFDAMFQLIRDLRTSITNASVDTPFITFEFVPGWVDTTIYPLDVNPIVQAQSDVLNNIHRVNQPSARVPTVLTGDSVTGGIHYNAASQRELGKRCNQTLDALLNQQSTLPTTLQSVTSVNITIYNTFVELVWNRVPYANGYYITEAVDSNISVNITYKTYKLHTIINNLSPSILNYTFNIWATYTNSLNQTVFSTNVATISTAGLSITGLPIADWKLNFTTGSAVNVGSKSDTIIPTAVNTNYIAYPSDSSRGHVVASLSSGYWDMGANSSLPLSYTKTFWINQASNSDGNIISTKVSNSGTSASHILMIYGKRIISYHTNNIMTLRSTIDNSLNTWSFYAITFDGTTRLMRLYMNGLFVSQRYLALPPSQQFEPCDVGSYFSSSASYYYVGKIDYPSVYPVVLSPGQVYAVYKSES